MQWLLQVVALLTTTEAVQWDAAWRRIVPKVEATWSEASIMRDVAPEASSAEKLGEAGVWDEQLAREKASCKRAKAIDERSRKMAGVIARKAEEERLAAEARKAEFAEAARLFAEAAAQDQRSFGLAQGRMT